MKNGQLTIQNTLEIRLKVGLTMYSVPNNTLVQNLMFSHMSSFQTLNIDFQLSKQMSNDEHINGHVKSMTMK